MSYELVLQSEAIIDIQESFEWHEGRRVGRGYEFIEEVEEVFGKITKTPQHYTAINERYRRCRLDRFPYLVIYEIEADKVFVVAVRRTSQEPLFK